MSRFDRLLQRLNTGERIVLDGAMGTEIQRRGVCTTLPLWSASVLSGNPEVVRQIHSDYIEAGADIICTNTFRTNERTYAKAGMSHAEAAAAAAIACDLANDARTQSGNDDVLIAGSVAPLEDCYRPDLVPGNGELKREHALWARSLADGGAEFIFVETMNCVRESVIALEEAVKTGLPVALSFVATPEGFLLSGESIGTLIGAVMPSAPFAIMLNCRPPATLAAALRILQNATDIPVGIYANGIGKPDDKEGWTFADARNGVTYASYAKDWADAGVRIIGGCCGTGPEDIRAIAGLCKARNSGKSLIC
jgi:S-methylmethionine-dependent homocysteine/selenocysteine methylase